MRYFGTKQTTRESVYEIVHGLLPSGSFCDAFAGIGSIGSFFKSKGYAVWSGDILKFAHCFQVVRIERDRNPSFKKLLTELDLDSVDALVSLLNQGRCDNGWFVREFSKKRRFFTTINAARIDSCRTKIIDWAGYNLLSPSELAVLTASLVNSMDKVANTAGTYYAYLKDWDRRALRPFSFELVPCTKGNVNCHVFHEEAATLVSRRSYDVLYLDPPHNSRDYAGYYHLPETLALMQTPVVTGKSGQPDRESPNSEFNRMNDASQSLKKILDIASFKILIFHYSDQGIIPRKRILSILGDYGRVQEIEINSLGYTTRHQERTMKHRLYVLNNN